MRQSGTSDHSLESHPAGSGCVSTCATSGHLSSCHRLRPLLLVSARARATQKSIKTRSGTRPAAGPGALCHTVKGPGKLSLAARRAARAGCSCAGHGSWRPELGYPKPAGPKACLPFLSAGAEVPAASPHLEHIKQRRAFQQRRRLPPSY